MDTHIMLVFYAKELAPNGVNGMIESTKLCTTYSKKLVLFVSSPLSGSLTITGERKKATQLLTNSYVALLELRVGL